MPTPRIPFLPRKRFFVKRGLQVRLALGVAVAAMLSFLLVLVDYYLSFGRNAGWDMDMLAVFLKAQKLPVVQLVIFVVVLVFITLKLSHRVAGPLVNLEKSLARVSAGDLTTRVQLRPRDELKDIRDAFNAMMSQLNSHVAADRARVGEIIKIMDHLGTSDTLGAAHVAELNRATALLRRLTADFKL
jgi:methyl-accepting chemotaxis protein